MSPVISLTYPLGTTVTTEGPLFSPCNVMFLKIFVSLYMCAVVLLSIAKATPSESNDACLNADWETELKFMMDLLIVLSFHHDYHLTILSDHLE